MINYNYKYNIDSYINFVNIEYTILNYSYYSYFNL